jgi:hypothetical protein
MCQYCVPHTTALLCHDDDDDDDNNDDNDNDDNDNDDNDNNDDDDEKMKNDDDNDSIPTTSPVKTIAVGCRFIQLVITYLNTRNLDESGQQDSILNATAAAKATTR